MTADSAGTPRRRNVSFFRSLHTIGSTMAATTT